MVAKGHSHSVTGWSEPLPGGVAKGEARTLLCNAIRVTFLSPDLFHHTHMSRAALLRGAPSLFGPRHLWGAAALFRPAARVQMLSEHMIYKMHLMPEIQRCAARLLAQKVPIGPVRLTSPGPFLLYNAFHT